MPRLDAEKDRHHFPFGCLSIAAPLEKLGLEYEIYDERVQDKQVFYEAIKSTGIVGISMFTGYQTHRAYDILKEIREINPDIITIVGGPHVSALPEQTVKSELVDYAVAGYADNAFPLLVQDLIQFGILKSADIPGIYYKNENVSLGTHTPKRYSDIRWHLLPYHKIDINSYIYPETERVMYVTQYGCPARCSFCATPETRKWTPKPLELVKKDIDTLYQMHPFKELAFFDATLFTMKKRVQDIITYLDSYPGLRWVADARAAELIKFSDDELRKIKSEKTDLFCFVVGLETGSKRIADHVINKGKDHLETFYEVAKRTHDVGIELTSGVIFGFPGDTSKDLEETTEYISRVREVHPDFKISTTFFKPLPGTDLYNLLEAQGHTFPKNLEEWAGAGESLHYSYNQWNEIPWLADGEDDQYRASYEKFLKTHREIMH